MIGEDASFLALMAGKWIIWEILSLIIDSLYHDNSVIVLDDSLRELSTLSIFCFIFSFPLLLANTVHGV